MSRPSRSRRCVQWFAAGEWATIVPHMWLRAMPVVTTAKAIRLVNPIAHVTISIAINAAKPGSVAARAFHGIANHLALNEFYANPDGPGPV